MCPREPIAVTPIAVSQYTAPALFGFKNERAFLDFVRERGLAHVRDGKTVLVAVEDLRAALADLRSTDDDACASVADDDDGEQTADQILALVGRRRA